MSDVVIDRVREAGQDSKRRIVPTQIAHVVVYTSRFEESLKFYKALLSLNSVHADTGLAFLSYDEEHHRVALVHVPNLQDVAPGSTGIHHVAFTFANLWDLLETAERLEGEGINPYWAVNHGPTISLYFRDPDGNRIEFQVDNFDVAEDAVAFCRLPEFAENPVGVDFVPADFLARLRAGETEAELKKRPNIGPRGLTDFPTG